MCKKVCNLEVVNRTNRENDAKFTVSVCCNNKKEVNVKCTVKKVDGGYIIHIYGYKKLKRLGVDLKQLCKYIELLCIDCFNNYSCSFMVGVNCNKKHNRKYYKVIKDVLEKLEASRVLGAKINIVEPVIEGVKTSAGEVIKPDMVTPMILVTFSDGKTYLTTSINFFSIIDKEIESVIDSSELTEEEKTKLKKFFDDITFSFIKIEDEDLKPIHTFSPMDGMNVAIFMDKTKITLTESKNERCESREMRKCKITLDSLAKNTAIAFRKSLQEEG